MAINLLKMRFHVNRYSIKSGYKNIMNISYKILHAHQYGGIFLFMQTNIRRNKVIQLLKESQKKNSFQAAC